MASSKAAKIDLFSLNSVQMRSFHLTWIACFVCFYAWFATAPLMPIISADLHFSKADGEDIAIAGVISAVLARFAIGPLCDRWGPRITYSLLLALGAIPVFGIAFAWDYTSFLVLRLLVGIIGASFVVTEFHASAMFAPNVVGTANATAGGWGNAGAGFTQSAMPLIFGALLGLGLSEGMAWRYAQLIPGVLMLVVAVLYYKFTQDAPEGNYSDLREGGQVSDGGKEGLAAMMEAGKNYRAWLLAACYAAAFGVELFVHSEAVTYYVSKFHLSVATAGYAVGAFGLLALFARPLGGILSDKVALEKGLDGRIWLFVALMIAEGGFMIAFSRMNTAGPAIAMMLIFGLFTHTACGSLYALVPFIDRKVVGGVCGIIGAGGNIGGVAAVFFLRWTGNTQLTFMAIGVGAIVFACSAMTIRFSEKRKKEERDLYNEAVAQRRAATSGEVPAMA